MAPQPDSVFNVTQFGCTLEPHPNTLSVRGFVRNAVNNQLIGDTSSANVKFLKEGSSQYVAAKMISNGLFELERIVSGNYIIQTTLNGYYPANTSIAINEYNIVEGTIADLFLSPVVSQGSYRAVLSWAEFPADLDAHVSGFVI